MSNKQVDFIWPNDAMGEINFAESYEFSKHKMMNLYPSFINLDIYKNVEGTYNYYQHIIKYKQATKIEEKLLDKLNNINLKWTDWLAAIVNKEVYVDRVMYIIQNAYKSMVPKIDHHINMEITDHKSFLKDWTKRQIEIWYEDAENKAKEVDRLSNQTCNLLQFSSVFNFEKKDFCDYSRRWFDSFPQTDVNIENLRQSVEDTLTENANLLFKVLKEIEIGLSHSEKLSDLLIRASLESKRPENSSRKAYDEYHGLIENVNNEEMRTVNFAAIANKKQKVDQVSYNSVSDVNRIIVLQEERSTKLVLGRHTSIIQKILNSVVMRLGIFQSQKLLIQDLIKKNILLREKISKQKMTSYVVSFTRHSSSHALQKSWYQAFDEVNEELNTSKDNINIIVATLAELQTSKDTILKPFEEANKVDGLSDALSVYIGTNNIIDDIYRYMVNTNNLTLVQNKTEELKNKIDLINKTLIHSKFNKQLNYFVWSFLIVTILQHCSIVMFDFINVYITILKSTLEKKDESGL